MYRPTNVAYGKGVGPPQSRMMQAFNHKKAASSKHRFYKEEASSPRHRELEKQKQVLNDTKDLASLAPRRKSLTESEYQEHLKEEVYTPKPTIFPVREKTQTEPTPETTEIQPRTKTSVASWGEYKPKHAGIVDCLINSLITITCCL